MSKKWRVLYLQNREQEGGCHERHEDARSSAKLVYCVRFTVLERLVDIVHELELEV